MPHPSLMEIVGTGIIGVCLVAACLDIVFEASLLDKPYARNLWQYLRNNRGGA